MPPHDVAAEQCVLGGMLLSKDAISDVIEVIRPTDHYRPAHQLVHEAILDLYARGEPADPITVVQRAQQARRADPHRRGPVPAHAHRVGAHRGERRLLRADRPGARDPAAACGGGHADRPVRLRGRRRRRRTRRPGPGRGLRGHRPPHRRGLPPAVRDHAPGPRGDRGDRRPRRRHQRRPHRLRRPGRPHQRPPRGPDGSGRGPSCRRQVALCTRFRAVGDDSSTGCRRWCSRWRWGGTRSRCGSCRPRRGCRCTSCAPGR